jgi:hypothetical protein
MRVSYVLEIAGEDVSRNLQAATTDLAGDSFLGVEQIAEEAPDRVPLNHRHRKL